MLVASLGASLVASIGAAGGLLWGCNRKEPPATPSPRHTTPRIVALSPALAIILQDLGHGEWIVGRHAFDHVLPASIPSCGDQAGIDYEALLRVRPTHVFTQWGQRDVPERLRTLAMQQGWTLLDANPLTLESIATATLALDASLQSTGLPSERATILAGQVRQLASPAPDANVGPRVVLLVGIAPATALGPGSCHHEVITGCNAKPAIENGLAFQDLSSEDLVRLDPDVIIWLSPRLGDSLDSENLVNESDPDPWSALRPLGLRALTTNRVAIITDPQSLMPSTAMIRVGEQMCRAIASN